MYYIIKHYYICFVYTFIKLNIYYLYMSQILDPDIKFIKSHFEVSSSMLENHNRLQIMCNRHDKFANNSKLQDQINKLKMEEELKYYKVNETSYYKIIFIYF